MSQGRGGRRLEAAGAVGGPGSGLGLGPACVLGAASPGFSGMMPRLPAGPCSLQSRCDNKTNNFLALLSWTPFIFPQPQGRTDLMVGPKCGSCTVTGGWARPARQGWATPAPLASPGQLPPLPSPAPSLFTASPSLLPSFPSSLSLAASPFIWASSSLCLPSFLALILPPLCFCPSLCLPPPHYLCPSFCLLPWLTALCPSSPLSQALCWQPLWGLCPSVSPPSDVWLCWADPGGAFPWDLLSSCCQGRGSWLARVGGRCPPGESLLLAPPG